MRARHFSALGLIAAAALLVTACQGSTPTAARLRPTGVPGKPAIAAPRYLKITPAAGTRNASPSGGIMVTAVNGGKIDGVTVRSTSAHPVTGTLSANGTSWQSTYALPTGQSYTVTVTGTGPSGHPVTATSTFTTLTPAAAFHAEIFEGAGATYGVGMPVMLTFDHPVTNRSAVERALTLTTSKPVTGAWYWDGAEQLDFRPRESVRPPGGHRHGSRGYRVRGQ